MTVPRKDALVPGAGHPWFQNSAAEVLLRSTSLGLAP